MKFRKRNIYILLTLFMLTLVGSCIWYVNDYYHSETIVEQYLSGNDMVTVEKQKGQIFLDGPGESDALVFYPGAKVEYTAYLPMLTQIAENGMDVFLVKMPCNLAIFGENRVKKIEEKNTYDSWYLMGHSLGGAMAANYVSKNPGEISGLFLLGAYPTKKLEDENLCVISIYGSKDLVVNREKIKEGRNLVPQQYKEIEIPGGNHAGYGYYGDQKGDGIADISKEEQQEQTVLDIFSNIKSDENEN